MIFVRVSIGVFGVTIRWWLVNAYHLIVDGWKTCFLFGMASWQVRTVSFREGSRFNQPMVLGLSLMGPQIAQVIPQVIPSSSMGS